MITTTKISDNLYLRYTDQLVQCQRIFKNIIIDDLFENFLKDKINNSSEAFEIVLNLLKKYNITTILDISKIQKLNNISDFTFILFVHNFEKRISIRKDDNLQILRKVNGGFIKFDIIDECHVRQYNKSSRIEMLLNPSIEY